MYSPIFSSNNLRVLTLPMFTDKQHVRGLRLVKKYYIWGWAPIATIGAQQPQISGKYCGTNPGSTPPTSGWVASAGKLVLEGGARQVQTCHTGVRRKTNITPVAKGHCYSQRLRIEIPETSAQRRPTVATTSSKLARQLAGVGTACVVCRNVKVAAEWCVHRVKGKPLISKVMNQYWMSATLVSSNILVYWLAGRDSSAWAHQVRSHVGTRSPEQ